MENELNYDDDDDQHYCLRCKATINGLDNYVKHRKLKCREKQEVMPLWWEKHFMLKVKL